MISSNPLKSKKLFYADFVYKYLMSITRGEDVSLTFYGIPPQKQKDTEQVLMKIAEDVAERVVIKWDELTKGGSQSLTFAQKEKLVKKALKLADEKIKTLKLAQGNINEPTGN